MEYETTRANVLAGESILDFPVMKGNSFVDLDFKMQGCEDGDPVSIGVPNDCINDNTSIFGWVSSDNIVTLRYFNNNDFDIKIPQGLFKIIVFKTIVGDLKTEIKK